MVGTEEAVRDAQKELEELIKSLVRLRVMAGLSLFSLLSRRLYLNCSLFWFQDNVVEENMIVDPKHHRYFVARRGQVLRDLADEYGGVMVSFPRTGTQSESVTLKGAKDCVEAAKKRMLEIVDDLVRRCICFIQICCLNRSCFHNN